MRLLFIFLFVSIFSFGQGGGKVDALKFRGKVTTAVRNTIDVPTGEFWLIYNTTTEALEVSDETDTWSNLGSLSTPNINFNGYTLAERNNLDVPTGEFWLIYNTTSDLLEISDSTENWQSVGDGIQPGQNSIPAGISLNQAITNKIEIIPASAGLFGSNPAIRIIAGNQDDAVYFVMYDDVVSWSFASSAEEYNINPNGETNINDITRKGYVDAAIAAIPSGGTIPDNSITSDKILNGTILEEDLSSAVVTKLNTTGGGINWSTPVDANIIPATNLSRDLGTPSNRFLNVFANTLLGSSAVLTGQLTSPIVAYTPISTPPGNIAGVSFYSSIDNRLKLYDGVSYKNILLEGDVTGGTPTNLSLNGNVIENDNGTGVDLTPILGAGTTPALYPNQTNINPELYNYGGASYMAPYNGTNTDIPPPWVPDAGLTVSVGINDENIDVFGNYVLEITGSGFYRLFVPLNGSARNLTVNVRARAVSGSYRVRELVGDPNQAFLTLPQTNTNWEILEIPIFWDPANYATGLVLAVNPESTSSIVQIQMSVKDEN